MRLSVHFPATRREMRQDLTPSHSLLEQGGYIRPSPLGGVYSLLPLGFRVHQKICSIIYQEMERAGVQNMQLPILQQKELWQKTGRWEKYENSRLLFKAIENHTGAEVGLAPTAEEIVTALVAAEVKSYRQMPLSLHQIGWKFRDEMRPRMGLLRCREFSMSDAYSFDRTQEEMQKTFELFRGIYHNVFRRVGLRNFISVQADSGTIGGQGSAEFMLLNESGEDVLLTCSQCDYGANVEKAQSTIPPYPGNGNARPIRHESTPNVMTVEELRQFFPDLRADQMIKTVIFRVNPATKEGGCVAVCIRGDLDINQTKLRNHLGAEEVEPADPATIEKITGARVGFAGPLGLKNVNEIFFDASTAGMTNFLCGYNKSDFHALDVNFSRDLPEPSQRIDLHVAREGHGCCKCGKGTLKESRGVEVGHIFMLQQGYSKMLDAVYLDDKGQRHTIWMGCYGIGTTRLMQAVAADNHDKDGLIWPDAVAPFPIHLLLTKEGDEAQLKCAELAEKLLNENNIPHLFDERPLRAGEKFKDADLIGCPYRVTVGRKAAEGIVEVRRRATGEVRELPVSEISTIISKN